MEWVISSNNFEVICEGPQYNLKNARPCQKRVINLGAILN